MCPQCKGKVRVPELSPEQLALSSPAMAIEFRCPRCQTAIRTPADSAGQKGRCPTCNGKVRVPQGEASVDGTSHSQAQSATSEMAYFGFGISPEDEPAAVIAAGPAALRQAARNQSPVHWIAVVLPMLSLTLLTAVAVYLIRNPRGAPGTATAVALFDDFDPRPMDTSVTDSYADRSKFAIDCLAQRPLIFKGEHLVMEFSSRKSAITLQLRAGTSGAFYRVNVSRSSALKSYARANERVMERARMTSLDEKYADFLSTLKKRCQANGPDSDLKEFGQSVGLTSLVEGLGYHVHAVVDTTAYPCVMEKDDELYFAMPRGINFFVIVGAQPKGSDAPVLNRVNVTVTGKIDKSAPVESDEPAPMRRSFRSAEEMGNNTEQPTPEELEQRMLR